MIKFRKRDFIETLENNETNAVHTQMPHMYSCRFQKHLYDCSARSLFEILTKPIYKCTEDRPYYATQYQDLLIQYNEGFNFVSGASSSENDDIHIKTPEGPTSLTPYTKATIRDGYVIPQETKLYHKSEKYKFFCKQNWFDAVHPNVQIAAKLDYMISRVLLEMDHTSLNNYKKTLRFRSRFKTNRFHFNHTKIPTSRLCNHKPATHIRYT